VRRFENKTVLVTGASSGIGLAAASLLAEEGARILAVSRDFARLAQAMAHWEDPSRHVALPLDARNDALVEAAASTIRQSYRPLHAAVLCVGQHALRPLQMVKSEWINELLASNLTATLLCSKLFLRCAGPEGGSLVWLSSVAALTGNPAEAVYAAAKGALVSACRSAAVEFAPRRIRVNVVAPGVVETPMSQGWLRGLTSEQLAAVKQRHLLGFGEPIDVAAAIAFLLSDQARWITGTTLVADGGYSCH
jgi:NAD(P)-dependent dehydrogenase (short-subunit alcohol dehydrogenase family)